MMNPQATKKEIQSVMDAVTGGHQRHGLTKLETGSLISVDDDGTLDPKPFQKLSGVREVLSIKVNLPKETPALAAL